MAKTVPYFKKYWEVTEHKSPSQTELDRIAIIDARRIRLNKKLLPYKDTLVLYNTDIFRLDSVVEPITGEFFWKVQKDSKDEEMLWWKCKWVPLKKCMYVRDYRKLIIIWNNKNNNKTN